MWKGASDPRVDAGSTKGIRVTDRDEPGRQVEFTGGRNIAMKVPPHLWEDTVAFYRDVVRLPVVRGEQGDPPSVCFAFGANQLWIDRVDAMSQAELWLELTTDDVGAAEHTLREAGVVRRDEIEPLPADFPGFWIQNPASIIHIVKRNEAGGPATAE